MAGYRVEKEHLLKDLIVYSQGHNPNLRSAPTPRPDFAILQIRRLVTFLDAKYRDLWANPFRRNLLYQLAIYTLSQKNNGTATILYPTTSSEAREAKTDINDPDTGSAGSRVILRPVHLPTLATLIADTGVGAGKARINYAMWQALG